MFEKVVGTFASVGYKVETLFEGRPNLYIMQKWISNSPHGYFQKIIVDEDGALISHKSAIDSREEKRVFRIISDNK